MTRNTPASPTTIRPERLIDTTSTTRRGILAAAGATILGSGMAGCLGDDEDEDTVRPDVPRIEDPPEAVYVPTHRDAMEHHSAIEAGEYMVTPMITYPHRFWLVTGDRTEEVDPDDTGGVHLMFTPWDPETGHVLPSDAGAEVRVLQGDNDVIETLTPWPMISQTMGFHFGDNVPLPDDGTYQVEIDLNPINIAKTGSFSGRLDTSATGAFEFEYSADSRASLIQDVEYQDEDDWGERGALRMMAHSGDMDGDDMDHDDMEEDHGDMNGEDTMPISQLPEADSYPGMDLGDSTSHDVHFVVRYLGDTRLADEGYLLVSPRTPYNRIPLADMALSVEGAASGTLTQTLDDEFGLHYGLETDLAAGDTLDVIIDAPPQVSRHTGFETAFLDMDSVGVTVPE